MLNALKIICVTTNTIALTFLLSNRHRKITCILSHKFYCRFDEYVCECALYFYCFTNFNQALLFHIFTRSFTSKMPTIRLNRWVNENKYFCFAVETIIFSHWMRMEKSPFDFQPTGVEPEISCTSFWSTVAGVLPNLTDGSDRLSICLTTTTTTVVLRWVIRYGVKRPSLQ